MERIIQFIRYVVFILSVLGVSGVVKAEKSLPVLKWGTDSASNTPLVFADPDHFQKTVGCEVEIIEALAEKMECRLEKIENNWEGLILGLGRNLYDVVICGVGITPEHEKSVTFSVPYYVTHAQLTVKKGEKGLQSFDDCVGKKVGALVQSHCQKFVEEKEGVHGVIYWDEGNAYEDLINGRLDAFLHDAPSSIYYVDTHPQQLQLVGPPVGRIEYGIVVNKKNPILLSRINQAIESIKKEGKLRHILDRWRLWNPMMADYLQDYGQSTKPTAYLNFISWHEKQSSGIKKRFNRYLSFSPILLQAAFRTLAISVLAMVLAVSVGFFVAMARVYGKKPIRMLAVSFIEIMRGTPLLIQLLLLFYGLPKLGINFNPYMAGVLGLGLNYAAFEAENYRSGILAVPSGQMEAARALGMNHWQSLRHVVMPQAFRYVLPPVTNDFISLLKDSSLVSMITIVDLTGAYTRLAATYYDYFGIGILVACIYLLIGLPFVRLARWTEKKLAPVTRKGGSRPSLQTSKQWAWARSAARLRPWSRGNGGRPD